jgi:hypothetical protein
LPVNSAGSTLADNSLAITKVGATDSRYWINVINTTATEPDGTSNKKVFNQAYKNELNNYLNAHPACPTNVIGWLKNIKDQIPLQLE